MIIIIIISFQPVASSPFSLSSLPFLPSCLVYRSVLPLLSASVSSVSCARFSRSFLSLLSCRSISALAPFAFSLSTLFNPLSLPYNVYHCLLSSRDQKMTPQPNLSATTPVYTPPPPLDHNIPEIRVNSILNGKNTAAIFGSTVGRITDKGGRKVTCQECQVSRSPSAPRDG